MLKDKYLACINLQRELTKRVIKGKVFVSINKGSFTICINSGKSVLYKRNVDDLLTKISLSDLTDIIEYEYHRFIVNRTLKIKKERRII